MISTMRTLFIAGLAIAALALVACGSTSESDDAFLMGASDGGSKEFASKDVEEAAFATAQSRVEPPAAPAPMAPTAPAAVPAPRPSAVAGVPGAPGASGSPGDTEQAVAQLVQQTRIIVRTVDMTIEVAGVSTAIDAISAMADEFGGWVVSTNRSDKHQGFIAIRIPADQLDTVIERLRTMAADVRQELTTSLDVTDEYVDTTARLNNLKATEDALLRLFEQAKTVEETLKVQDSLTDVQSEIERLEGRIKFLEETAAFSLVNVRLVLEPAEMSVDAGMDQTVGVGNVVRYRAFFKPPEGMENFTFEWDFGDGSPPFFSNRTAPTEDEDTRVTATVTHAYFDDRDSPFFAKVKVTATGETGIAEGEDTFVATVTKIPSIEVFGTERVVAEAGEELELVGTFTRPAEVRNVKYSWDFADGTDPAEGDVAEGETRVSVTHTYADHRSFPFDTRLTITAESDAGDVESSFLVRVQVTEARGWTVAGWEPVDQLKTAVRALSTAGQWSINILIWAVIFSPIVAVVGYGGYRGARRMRNRPS